MNGRKRPRTGIERHHLAILIERLQNQTDVHSQAKYLTELANHCEEANAGMKKFVLKSDGITVILEILFMTERNTIREMCLKTLAFLSLDCVEIKTYLGFPNLFIFLCQVLNETRSKALLKTTLYFLSCIVYQNKAGQILIRTSQCLSSLLELFVSYKPTASNLEPSEKSFDIWRFVVNVLNACVNSPQNESNQDTCGEVLTDLVELFQTQTKEDVLLPTITLMMAIIDNNKDNKIKFAEANGIEAIFQVLQKGVNIIEKVSSTQTLVENLFTLLDISVLEDDKNIMKCSMFNAVPLLINYLEKRINLSTKLQIIILLGHIIEKNTINKMQFWECCDLQALIKLMVTGNTDIAIAITCLLVSSKEVKFRKTPDIKFKSVSEAESDYSNDQKATEDTKLLKSSTSKHSVFSTASVYNSVQNQNLLSQNVTSKTSHLVSSSVHSYLPSKIKTPAKPDFIIPDNSHICDSQLLNLPGCSHWYDNPIPIEENRFNIPSRMVQQSRSCMWLPFQKETPTFVPRYNCYTRFPAMKNFHLNSSLQQLNHCCEASTSTENNLRNADIENGNRSNILGIDSQSSVLENQSCKLSTRSKKLLTSSSSQSNNSRFKMPRKDDSGNIAVLAASGKSAYKSTSSSDSSSNESLSSRSSYVDSKDSKLITDSYANKRDATVQMHVKASTVGSLLHSEQEGFICSLKPTPGSNVEQKVSLADLWKTNYKILIPAANDITRKSQKQTLVIESQKSDDDTSEYETAYSTDYEDVCDTVDDANSDDTSSLSSSYRPPEKRKRNDKKTSTEASEIDVSYLDRKMDFSKKSSSIATSSTANKVKKNSTRRKRINYTKEELEYLRDGVHKYGEDYHRIRRTYEFQPSRTAADLSCKWRKMKFAENKKSKSRKRRNVQPFTNTEIVNLEKAVFKYGHRWSLILKRFQFEENRTPQQLREKWRNIVKHYPMTNVELSSSSDFESGDEDFK